MDIQQRLITFIKRTNWVLFALTCIVGYLLTAPPFLKGLVFGGFIVTLNFHLMARTLRKAFAPPHTASISSIIAKYYVRFTVSAILIFLLIYNHIVDPLGLIIGLSIVMISMMLATLLEITKLIFKEAT
ncbi:ATP synthase subunit I [Desulfatitalea alkaliphila]|uniref:ATP synthase subunit I n=1 Tax=Desulfatitalea alkaliphila TaxID=2929485 RepID=A0AA41R4H4_9BACT|nr:ATP synthase subunit I [Desulfatitalea alkaliphila]